MLRACKLFLDHPCRTQSAVFARIASPIQRMTPNSFHVQERDDRLHDLSWALPVRTPPNLGISKQSFYSPHCPLDTIDSLFADQRRCNIFDQFEQGCSTFTALDYHGTSNRYCRSLVVPTAFFVPGELVNEQYRRSFQRP